MSNLGFWKPVYQLFEPDKPLATAEELNSFYVQRDNSPVEQLVPVISLKKEPAKFLLAGHQGSGKTTELRRLQQQIGHNHTVIWIDAEYALNKFNAGHAEVVILIGLEIYNQAKRSDWKLSSKLYKDLEDCLKTVVKADSQTQEGAFKLPEIIEKLGLVLKRGFDRKQTRSLSVLPVLEDILKCVNNIIKAAEKELQQKLLVIVDGLDKHELSMLLDMFCRSRLLTEPECHIIYSIPLALRYSTEFRRAIDHFNECFPLNNLPVFHCEDNLVPSKKPHRAGRDTMIQVVNKRLARLSRLDRNFQGKTIVQGDALEEIVEKSGGVIRDLVRLMEKACAKALARNLVSIDLDTAKQAIKEEHLVYNLSDYHYPQMSIVHRTGKLTTEIHHLPARGEFIICDDLLQKKYILGYDHESGNVWFDVHPILIQDVEDWLEKQNLQTGI